MHVSLDDTEPFTINGLAKDTEEYTPLEIQLFPSEEHSF